MLFNAVQFTGTDLDLEPASSVRRHCSLRHFGVGSILLGFFLIKKKKSSIALIKIPDITLVPFSLINKRWNDRIYRCAAGHLLDIGFAQS